MRVLRSCCCIHSCLHLKLICNRMTFYNGHRNTACNLYVHLYGRGNGFLNESFPTFIAAVIEISPDRSLVVTQPRFTWELPGTVTTNKAFGTVTTNKAFFMSDFHVFPELKIIRELSRALFTSDHIISPQPVKSEETICLHSVCLSFCLSVTQVFRTFLGCAFTYLHET